jgi:imidazolonepropionase-like amidohydrolase
MPGLVDMHVHTWMESDQVLFLANGVTTVRNMFGSPLHLRWRDEIERGERLGPTIVTAGPIVDGDPPVWPGSRVVTTPDEARAAVREQAEAGYDFVKAYARLPAEAYDALLAAAAETGLPVDGHVPDAVGVERVLASDQRTLEHLLGYGLVLAVEGTEGDLLARELAAWSALDEERVERWARRTQEAGTWNCPTLVVLAKWLPDDEIPRELERPCMRYVPPMLRGMWFGMLSRVPADRRAVARQGDAGRKRFVRALDAAGARIVVGTDAGNPYVLAGFSLHEELAALVDAGLAPERVLRAATRDAAECLGQLDEVGTVAPGRRADLLLLEADPREDVGHAARPLGVVARGRWLPREELEGLLASAFPQAR